MASRAKVFAHVFGYERLDTTPDKTLRFTIEYCFITGDRRSGKFSFEPEAMINETKLTDDLKEGLAAHLNERFSPAVFTAKDIIGCGV